MRCFASISPAIENCSTLARRHVVADMAEHLTHTGVHDHGFNNISTYGNLRRLMLAGRIETNEWELRFYELALKVSGAVQAARWTSLPNGLGYIYSFNGSHSLFIDTMRTLRVCGIAHHSGPRAAGRAGRAREPAGPAACARRRPRRSTTFTTARGATIYDVPELARAHGA